MQRYEHIKQMIGETLVTWSVGVACVAKASTFLIDYYAAVVAALN